MTTGRINQVTIQEDEHDVSGQRSTHRPRGLELERNRAETREYGHHELVRPTHSITGSRAGKQPTELLRPHNTLLQYAPREENQAGNEAPTQEQNKSAGTTL